MPGIGQLLAAYADGSRTPAAVLRELYATLARRGNDHVWIHVLPIEDALRQLEGVEARQRTGAPLPLFGVPFAIKDNIDVAGHPTTAGCPAFAYMPEASATVVRRLQDAGAILVGKTNLDQFATGLVGTRSPYGALSIRVRSATTSPAARAPARRSRWPRAWWPSRSAPTPRAPGACPPPSTTSSGSSPPVGWSARRGSCRPAARSTASRSWRAPWRTPRGSSTWPVLSMRPIRTRASPDRLRVRSARASASACPRPPSSSSSGTRRRGRLYERALERLEALGGRRVTIDLAPFRAAADLLYSGPWVAERLAALGPFFDAHPEEIHRSCGPSWTGRPR